MTNYKPGDTVSLSREGKVFIAPYQSISGFASITRVIGDDVAAEIEDMQKTLDRAFKDSLRRNLMEVSACYDAAGGGEHADVDLLLTYLETADEPQEEAVQKPKLKRKRKL